MSDAEVLIEKLRTRTRSLEEAIALLPAERRSVPPGPGCWSAVEVLEHVGIVDRLFGIRLAGATPASPREAAAEAERAMEERVASRGNRVPAPEMTSPRGKYRNCDEALADLHTIEQQLAKQIRDRADTLRCSEVQHPLLGTLSSYEGYLALAAHGMRHAAQIREMASVAS